MISNITSTSAVSFMEKLKTEKSSGDFVAILNDAMKRRKNEQPKDTYESRSALESVIPRNSLNDARKLDENGQPLDAVTATDEETAEFRKVFHQFAGQTLYGQMLKGMRETQQKPAYFHGGRTEEIFQEQLDNVLVEKITQATPDSFSETMFSLMK